MLPKRFVKFFAHVRRQSLGRLNKPIIRLHATPQTAGSQMKVSVRGNKGSVFPPSRASSCKKGRIISTSWCLLVCVEKLHRSLVVSPPKWVGAGEWMNVQQGMCSPWAWLSERNCTGTAGARAHEP